MTEAGFWTIVAMLNWAATGDDDAVAVPAVTELAKYEIEEIHEFQSILARKLYALDTRAHAEQIGEYAYREGEGFSVDWFLYARCAVVANGEQLYTRVLENPPEFPMDIEFESLLYLAPEAYERKTGAEYNHVAEPSYETFSNVEGWRQSDRISS